LFKLDIDYIILSHQSVLGWEQYSKHVNPDIIVLDHSCKKWQIDKIKEDLLKLNNTIVSLNDVGSLLLN